MTYVPGKARIGEPTPQTDPELFTDDEIRAEIKYLLRLDKRYGPHLLRFEAVVELAKVLESREKSQ